MLEPPASCSPIGSLPSPLFFSDLASRRWEKKSVLGKEPIGEQDAGGSNMESQTVAPAKALHRRISTGRSSACVITEGGKHVSHTRFPRGKTFLSASRCGCGTLQAGRTASKISRCFFRGID